VRTTGGNGNDRDRYAQTDKQLGAARKIGGPIAAKKKGGEDHVGMVKQR